MEPAPKTISGNKQHTYFSRSKDKEVEKDEQMKSENSSSMMDEAEELMQQHGLIPYKPESLTMNKRNFKLYQKNKEIKNAFTRNKI